MRQDILVNRINAGLGRAAQQVGAEYDVLRPQSSSNPLAASNHVTRLPILFDAGDERLHRTPAYGHAIWHALLDATMTRAGDFLVGPSGTFFIAAQPPLLSVPCVLINRTVSVLRPEVPSGVGATSYGGMLRGRMRPVLLNWPASLLDQGGHGNPVGLPGDGMDARGILLLPKLPTNSDVPRAADMVSDDLARNWVVGSVEESELGWRIVLRQVGS